MKDIYLIKNLYIDTYSLIPLYLEDNVFYRIPRTGSNDKYVENEYVVSFGEFLTLHELGIMLKMYKYLSLKEVNFLINITNQHITTVEKEKLKKHINYCSKLICDLLGLNINDNPSTNKNLDRYDVIVSAPKVIKFRGMLEEYLFTGLSIQDSLVISNNSLIIILLLKESHIKMNDAIKNNNFKVKVTKGDVKLENEKVYKIS